MAGKNTHWESPQTRAICTEMEHRNAYIFRCVASKMQTPGWPDRCVVHKWIETVWLEMKGAHTPLRLDQKIVLREMRRRCPTSAYVVRLGGVNSIEDEEGNVIANFDGTGAGLLTKLKELKDAAAAARSQEGV